MVRSKRESNKLKCRIQILKASRRLFNKRGFEDTTIEEIAREADISNATFYNYFPTKESLLIGTAEDLDILLHDYINNELNDEKDLAQKIRKLVEYMTIDIKPFASLSRKMNYLNACKESVMFQKMRMRSIIHDLVCEAQNNGDIKPGISTETVCDIYMSIFLVAIYQWPDFCKISDEECKSRIDSYLDLVLEDVLA